MGWGFFFSWDSGAFRKPAEPAAAAGGAGARAAQHCLAARFGPARPLDGWADEARTELRPDAYSSGASRRPNHHAEPQVIIMHTCTPIAIERPGSRRVPSAIAGSRV